MNDIEFQEILGMRGFIQVLLLIIEEEKTVGDLVRDRFNLQGVASDGTIRSVRKVFNEYGLVEEVHRMDPSRRGGKSIHLVITLKGRRVVRTLRKVKEEIES